MIELSLRPYNGRLFLVKTAKQYEKAHLKLFKRPDEIELGWMGRFSGEEGKNGTWTYLVWANGAPHLAHEFSHVVLHVFKRCGIDPNESVGEPFCYMLSQLLIDAGVK